MNVIEIKNLNKDLRQSKRDYVISVSPLRKVRFLGLSVQMALGNRRRFVPSYRSFILQAAVRRFLAKTLSNLLQKLKRKLAICLLKYFITTI